MGIFDRLRPDLRAAATLVGPAAVTPTTSGALPLVSPFAGDHHLQRVAWADIYGDALRLVPVTRAEAMAVPAMARARHIIAGTIATVQLRGYRGDQLLGGDNAPAPPSWLRQTGNGTTPFHRMLWTVDDLIFYGWSCWRRVNGFDGFPLSAYRVPVGEWSVQAGVVHLHDGPTGTPRPANADEVIMIPGPHEGLLSFAAGSIRHAADLQRAAGVAAATPSANLLLKQTAGTPLTDPQIDALIARWAAARRGENGGVAWASIGVDVDELGTFDAHLLVDGRNAAAVDIARHASLPADLVDATNDSSLTYSNSRDNDRRGIDYGSGLYMGAISSTLSDDQVVPHGQRVAFDLEEWLAGTVPGQPAGQPATPAATPAPVVPSGETAL